MSYHSDLLPEKTQRRGRELDQLLLAARAAYGELIRWAADGHFVRVIISATSSSHWSKTSAWEVVAKAK